MPMGRGRRRLYIVEWRKHRNLTQAALAERLSMSEANLSRLENAQQDYTQSVLEALADALRCDPADLIMRPPGAATELQTVIERLEPEQQEQALRIIKALVA